MCRDRNAMAGSVGSWFRLCCLTVACEMSDPGIVDSLIPEYSCTLQGRKHGNHINIGKHFAILSGPRPCLSAFP
ncbi:hypothetical protein BPSY_0888 [Bifidobacterium psychraerophilum]|uniref:Uncharacterized protein n=1 Tax=Bifidobacterium psychraerophilum TaxID=218140 RepID=A0A087CFJ0_9BIFI|nr:hypothetical protein BPSY_0888 [Bifidobacterium psychraerophilum]